MRPVDNGAIPTDTEDHTSMSTKRFRIDHLHTGRIDRPRHRRHKNTTAVRSQFPANIPGDSRDIFPGKISN